MGYKPIVGPKGLTLHYWYTYLGDTRCGGVVEEGSSKANTYTMVIEDADATFYARNGTSAEASERLNEIEAQKREREE
jgi:hypothetical protein